MKRVTRSERQAAMGVEMLSETRRGRTKEGFRKTTRRAGPSTRATSDRIEPSPKITPKDSGRVDSPGLILNLLHSTTSALMKLPKIPPLKLVANIPVTRMNKKKTPGGGVKPSLKVSMYPASGSSPRSKNIPAAMARFREEGEEVELFRRWRVAL